MGYKRKLFSDKTIVAAAAVGVIAVSAIVGGALLTPQDGEEEPPIVNLSEEDTNENGNLLAENDKTNQDESGMIVSEQNDVTAIQPGDEEDGGDDRKHPDVPMAEQGAVTGEEEESGEDDDSGNEEADASDMDASGESDEEDDGVEPSDEASGLVGPSFSGTSTLVWPVEGNVLIDFDMENTVYFPTLDLYKCSDAVYIQSSEGTPVYAGYACVIEEVSYNSEIGNNVTVSMGNDYMLTYGQLKDVQVEKGDVLKEGDLIGYIGSPTKYYTVEGTHLYMKMTQNGTPVDPLDYLNYE